MFNNLLFSKNDFLKKYILIGNKRIYFYQSPLLTHNKFIHAFFTKKSSEIKLNLLGNKLIKNQNSNYFINQIHSNNIVKVSELKSSETMQADGLINDHKNQNLWIYTADCMPILFADKCKRRIAAIHCGRKGLEKNIITNAIKSFEIMGSSRKDILVSIGPSISGDNYLLDKKTFYNFFSANNVSLGVDKEINIINNLNDHELISLDIKKYAYLQLLKENLDPNNIDISNKCTYSLPNEFHSWRRSKNCKRQWSVISS